MPRKPRIFDDGDLKQVEGLASVLNTNQIADYFGIGRTAFYELRKRQPEVEERYKRGKAKAIGKVARGLLNQAENGNTSASIFYLKTQAGWRDQTEVVVEKPINIHVSNLSEEDAAALYKRKILEK